MPDGFNTLGVNDWASPPLANLGVNDWQQPAPPPPAPPPPPPPEPPSSTLAGMGKAVERAPFTAAGELTQAAGAIGTSVGTVLQSAASTADAKIRSQIGVMDRIDAGESIQPTNPRADATQLMLDFPYQFGRQYSAASPEMRDKIRTRIEGDIAALPAPQDTGLGQAGGVVKSAGQSVMDAGADVIQYGEKAVPMTPEEQGRFSVRAIGIGSSVVPYVLASLGGPEAVAALAGVQGFGSHYEAAKKAGASDEDAAKSAVFGGATNAALMLVPIHQAMDIAARLPNALKGEFFKTVGEVAKSSATMVAFSQMQTVADNLVAKATYAPDQSVTQGVGENMGVQGVVGAVLPFGGAAVGAAARLAGRALPSRPNVQPKPVVQDVFKAPDVDNAIDAAAKVAEGTTAAPDTTQGARVSDTTPGTPSAADASRHIDPLRGSIDVRDVASDLEGGDAHDIQQSQLLRMFDNTGAGTVEQAPDGSHQFRTTDATGAEVTHPIEVWNPYAPPDDTAGAAPTISTETADALRSHYGEAGVHTVFYQDDPAIPFDGAVDPNQPDTLFLSNNPARNIAQVATHEFTHVLSATTLPDGTSLGDLLNQQVAAGITPAGQRYAAKTFGATAPARAGFAPGAEGDAAHAAAVQTHLISELGTDIGGEAPKFQSFLPRVVDAIQARFGDSVAGDVLGKLINGLKSAMETIRGLFDETGTRSQNWVTNIGEIHDTLAKMYAAKFGTPVERGEAAQAAIRDRLERDGFVAPEKVPEAATPTSSADLPAASADLSAAPADDTKPPQLGSAEGSFAASREWPETRDGLQATALKLRRWLGQLADQRDAAAASTPRATILKQTEAAILRPVEGDETRLPEAGKTRLEQVRTQIDETTHPVADTPAMAKVREELAATAAAKEAAGRAYVTTPEGSPDLGRIDETMAAAIGSVPAPIRLTRFGEEHIADHHAELAMHGFSSPFDFVHSVATRFGEIWSAGGDSVMLVRRVPADGHERAHSLYVLLQHGADGGAYEVQSGGVFRRAYPKGSGRKLLWRDERANIVSAGTDSRTTPHRPQTEMPEPGTVHSAEHQSEGNVGNPDVERNGPGDTPDVRQPNAALVESMPPAPADPAQGEDWWKHKLTGTGRQMALDAAGLKRPVTTAWQYLSVADRAKLMAANRALPRRIERSTDSLDAVLAGRLTPRPDRGAGDLDPGANGNKPPGTVPPEPVRPVDYGANNTTFTADAAERARARLREKLGRLNAGFDPEMMLDGLTLAGFHIEAGARTFAEYSKRMIEDIGDGVRPFLAHFYHSVRDYPGFDAAGMDDRGKVDAELKRAADASTSAEEAPDVVGPADGGLDQPGGGEAGAGGRLSGQPAGDGHAGGVETGASADVPAAGEPGAEAGVRAGPEALPVGETVHQGGDAANGRGGTGDAGVVPVGTGGSRVPVPTAVRPNFHIDDPERLIGGTPKVRFTRNRAAIEALRAIEEEQRAPTPEELQSLAGYIGWGSFGQDLFQGTFERQTPRPGWDAEGQWLRDHLGKDAWESAQRSIINAHYTDPPTVKTMWDMVQRMGFKGGRILEPSMGIGNFFGLMPRDVMANSTLTGIELDRLTARMAKLLYPQAGIHQKGYQESRTPDNFYDLVIGNWPFAAQSPADRRYDRLSPTLHDYFFLKALDQTRPGGLVVGITSAGTMDKAGRSARIELAKKGELLGAFRLPLGAFEKYAGTAVVTDILVFRKRTEPAANVLDEPWINASDMATPSGQTIRVNDHFKANPDAVLGTLDFGRSTIGRQGMTVHRGADFPDRLASLPDRLPNDGFSPVIRGSEPRFITNNSADRQNAVTIGDDGKLYQVQGERMTLLEDVSKQMRAGSPGVSSRNAGKTRTALVNQVESLVGMRRAYGALIDAERDGRPETEDIRQSLAQQYAAFVRAHGPLADAPGLKLLNRLKDPAYGALAALERPDGSPSRILSEPTIRSRRSLANPTISDAYVIARNETATSTWTRGGTGEAATRGGGTRAAGVRRGHAGAGQRLRGRRCLPLRQRAAETARGTGRARPRRGHAGFD